MKIIGITIFTDPDYRQDPARECVRQILEICDEAVIVYGKQDDQMIVDHLEAEYPGRIHSEYMEWPQPEWTMDQLPKHLNQALEIARQAGADWIIKYDSDCFINEKDKEVIRKCLLEELHSPVIAMMVEKVHMITSTHALMKSDIPVIIKAKSQICYGQNLNHYTDLCQPIIWNQNAMYEANDDKSLAIPTGQEIPRDLIKRTGVWQYNYGYCFKTFERSFELLYWFDIAHALWWGVGWHKTPLTGITQDSAMYEFIKMMTERVGRALKRVPIEQHPKHIQPRLRGLKPEQFGYNCWGKIKLPE